LKERLHKLKGGAGMIGALNIHRLAGAAETALAPGHAPELVGTLLGQLAAAFTALGEELASMLSAESRDTVSCDSVAGHRTS
jgi:HPt (histidine-containing phosphotransfer) domain-containing protein